MWAADLVKQTAWSIVEAYRADRSMGGSVEGRSWFSHGDSYQSETGSKLISIVNGFSIIWGLDLGTPIWKSLPVSFLDHRVMQEEKMSYYTYLSSEMEGNQAVQRSEIIHVILTDEVSEREREFLYNKRWLIIEGKFSEV